MFECRNGMPRISDRIIENRLCITQFVWLVQLDCYRDFVNVAPSTVHGAICVRIKCFVCVSISIFSVNNGRNNRSAHFVLCFFCCILGLLDSCIILLHFTEFTDLYFIRYGFFCLHSPAFFFLSVCACLHVWVAVHSSLFFGRFLFFIAFHIRIHELFFASFGYKQFSLRSSQSCNVKTEHEKMEKSQKKLENAQKRIRLETRSV